jgi:pantothenate kinase
MFDRTEWAAVRGMSLTDAGLAMLSRLNQPVSITDVAEIFLPLCRLLNLLVLASCTARGLLSARN